MDKPQRVVLYGDTLVLAGVRASLLASPDVEVIALEASQAAEQDLLALHPDVIIFDTSSVQPKLDYSLSEQLAGLKLIGIDPDSSQVLLWSGQSLRELSVQGLLDVIHQKESI